MSSLAAVQADGYYLPPEYYEAGAKVSKNEWWRRQQKGSGGKPSHPKVLTVRFELPDPCVCLRCHARIGRGTRFNAQKVPIAAAAAEAVGPAHDGTATPAAAATTTSAANSSSSNDNDPLPPTRLFEYHMKCRICAAAHFVVRLLPDGQHYEYDGDWRPQVREWDATAVHGLVTTDDRHNSNDDNEDNDMTRLEQKAQQQRFIDQDRKELQQLLDGRRPRPTPPTTTTLQDNDAVDQDLALNAQLRQARRHDRRDRQRRRQQARRYGWGKSGSQGDDDDLTLLPATTDDRSQAAGQVFGRSTDRQQAQRWQRVREASLFATDARSGGSAPRKPATAASAAAGGGRRHSRPSPQRPAKSAAPATPDGDEPFPAAAVSSSAAALPVQPPQGRRPKRRRIVVGRLGMGANLSTSLVMMTLALLSLVGYCSYYNNNYYYDDDYRRESYERIAPHTLGYPLPQDHTARDVADVVDLSRNDPALRGLRQAACAYLWAAPSPKRGWGVYTVRDLPRKHVLPVTDRCFVVDNNNAVNDRAGGGGGELAITTMTTVDTTTLSTRPPSVQAVASLWSDEQTGMTTSKRTVLCQGYGALLNHMPDDASRAATSKLLLRLDSPALDNNNTDHRHHTSFGVAVQAHHKIKAGAELTTDFGPRLAARWFHSDGTIIPATPPAQEPDWLRENGVCLDGLADGVTASRPWSAGEVLTVSPVVPLALRGGSRHGRSLSAPLAQQPQQQDRMDEPLILNYCLRRADQEGTYYFPTGPSVGTLVAMSLTKKTSDDDSLTMPNVAIRWSDHLAGGILEVYAIRRIDQGEVLVLDLSTVALGPPPVLAMLTKAE